MSDELEYYEGLLDGAPSWAIDQVREEAESLRSRVAELEAAVQSSYREGYEDGRDVDDGPQNAQSGWKYSAARELLEGRHDE